MLLIKLPQKLKTSLVNNQVPLVMKNSYITIHTII
jgi:hypothetical protein